MGQTGSREDDEHLYDDGGQKLEASCQVSGIIYLRLFFFVVEYNSIFLLFTLFYNAVNDS